MKGASAIEQWITRNEKKIFIALYIILLLGFLGRVAIVGYGAGSGGNWYYSWLTSIVIDGDIDFSNQYELFPYRHAEASELFYEKVSEPGLTRTGMQGNGTAMGSAILWMPFFIIAHLLVLFLNLFGAEIATNGYSLVHEVITLAGSILYATLGMWLSYKFANKFTSKTNALIATLSILLGFATIQYVSIEPSIGHAATIFTVTLFLTTLYKYRESTKWKHWAILGILSGLMMLTRWQEGFFTIAALITWIRLFTRTPSQWKKHFANGFLYLGILIAVFSPQLVALHLLQGGYFSLPQEAEGIMDFTRPQLYNYLFSYQHSLLVMTPIIILSLLGIPLFYKKEKFWCATLVIILLIFLYVNSSLQEFGGNAFGMRRMIDHFPVFTLFLSILLQRLSTTKTYIPLLLLILFLVAFNLTYMLEYDLNIIHRTNPVPYTEIFSKAGIIPEKILSLLGK